jgi:hypothetical protein
MSYQLQNHFVTIPNHYVTVNAHKFKNNFFSSILNFVSKSIAVSFGNMINDHDMRQALIPIYEKNIQIKRTKKYRP